MKKNTRNILVDIGAAMAGIGTVTVVSYSIVKKMIKIAMDREMPEEVAKGKEMLMGSPEIAEFMVEVSHSAEKLKESDHEIVEVMSHDGLRLVGHWFTCKNPKRVIIAMHGWRSSWNQDFGTIADFLHNSDCNVLYTEQRGQGESDGEYMGFGMLERYDTRSWINWINENTESPMPIYLAGVSMGATTVLMATGIELPDNVKGVIADCGFTSPQAIWKHVTENNLHMPYGLYSDAASDLCKEKINLSANHYSAIDAMGVCKVPVLFIHGTDDTFVPIEMTYENYKACTGYKELLVVPGAGHGMSHFIDKTKYEKAIMDFWEHFDRL